MKRTLLIGCILVMLISLSGCGKNTDYASYVVGKSFVYEKEGIGGDFKIDINEDGTFFYIEGLASSWIGEGSWSIEDNMIILTDTKFQNRFEIRKGKLIFRSEGSDNFTYITVKDGEAFKEQ